MNWFIPISLTIFTFIGVYFLKETSSLSFGLFSALAAFIAGTGFAYLRKNNRSND